MKKTILFTMLALLGMIQAAAQEYEYVPFVREGVKWVYYYDNPFMREILDMDEGIQYYSFEMKGDVVIDDKHYKQVCLTHYLDENNQVVEGFIPVYLREEDKVVYAIQPDDINHPQCPVGIGNNVSESFEPTTGINEEFVLYDFNDPMILYNTMAEQTGNSLPLQYLETDMTSVGTHLSKRHHYIFNYSDNSIIVESIGADCGLRGTPLFYFAPNITGLQVGYYFSHVIEDGKIIYKAAFYNPDVHVGIDEVADGQTLKADCNYYDLMGRAVGKDVPTTPGIFIHQGEKIVIR